MEIKNPEPATGEKPSLLLSLQSLIHKAEDGILVGLLLLMISMATVQIFLRNLFEAGILWGDVLVRILVLWIGLAGAMVASRNNNHINIDVIARYLPERARVLAECIVAFFTAAICSIVAWHSFRFVQMEFEDGGKAFAQVPVWVCEAIIPFAFSVIALRYLILSFANLKRLLQSGN